MAAPEGAATIAPELTASYATSIDHVFVPVGNGSLACGIVTSWEELEPGALAGTTGPLSCHQEKQETVTAAWAGCKPCCPIGKSGPIVYQP